MKERIGQYQILGLVSEGRGPLYRARTAEGRVLALKAIPAEGANEAARQRFSREAAISTTLDHPNLVRVWDAGEADGFFYLAMDLLEGCDLKQLLAERRELSWPQKLSVMDQICAGLEYVHSRNLVHRDIKPANVFLEDSGRVRILDFGVARVASSKLTRPGSAIGTVGYMAPEQVLGETCTPASDVFAAGIVLYELATGQHPFAGKRKDPSRIMTAILFRTPPSIKGLVPDAPDGLDVVISQALEKNALRRQALSSSTASGGVEAAITPVASLAKDERGPAAAPPPAAPGSWFQDYPGQAKETAAVDGAQRVPPQSAIPSNAARKTDTNKV